MHVNIDTFFMPTFLPSALIMMGAKNFWKTRTFTCENTLTVITGQIYQGWQLTFDSNWNVYLLTERKKGSSCIIMRKYFYYPGCDNYFVFRDCLESILCLTPKSTPSSFFKHREDMERGQDKNTWNTLWWSTRATMDYRNGKSIQTRILSRWTN